MKVLSGKGCLVTGGASGIGRAIVERLLARGANVAIVDVNVAAGEKAVAELSAGASASTVLFFPADVSRVGDLTAAFTAAQKALGSLHVVVNNAGIGDEDRWELMLDLNLRAVIAGSYLASSAMHDNVPDAGDGDRGVIINVASMGGLLAMPFAPIYCATKHAVVGLSRSLTPWAEDGIRVNALCPSFTHTALVTAGVEGSAGMAIAVDGVGLLQPSQVAEGAMRLIDDHTLVGQAMRVTVLNGIDLAPFGRRQRSKL